MSEEQKAEYHYHKSLDAPDIIKVEYETMAKGSPKITARAIGGTPEEAVQRLKETLNLITREGLDKE